MLAARARPLRHQSPHTPRVAATPWRRGDCQGRAMEGANPGVLLIRPPPPHLASSVGMLTHDSWDFSAGPGIVCGRRTRNVTAENSPGSCGAVSLPTPPCCTESPGESLGSASGPIPVCFFLCCAFLRAVHTAVQHWKRVLYCVPYSVLRRISLQTRAHAAIKRSRQHTSRVSSGLLLCCIFLPDALRSFGRSSCA